MYRQRRGGGNNVGLILLALQVARIGLDNIPPVTLIVGGINVLLHYFDTKLSIYDVCIGAGMVWQQLDLQRLLLASFFHVDDMHLYYNMTSFLWKGRDLEPRLGPRRFATLIVLFALVSNALMVVGSVFLARYADMPGPYNSCAVGFSAVLFALKVVSTYYSTSPYSRVMGFVVPTQYLYWVELVLIHVLVPRSSFFGHLCGILAGLLYIRGAFRPVLELIDFVFDFFLRGPSSSPRGGGSSGGRTLRDGVIYPDRHAAAAAPPADRAYGRPPTNVSYASPHTSVGNGGTFAGRGYRLS